MVRIKKISQLFLIAGLKYDLSVKPKVIQNRE